VFLPHHVTASGQQMEKLFTLCRLVGAGSEAWVQHQYIDASDSIGLMSTRTMNCVLLTNSIQKLFDNVGCESLPQLSFFSFVCSACAGHHHKSSNFPKARACALRTLPALPEKAN